MFPAWQWHVFSLGNSDAAIAEPISHTPTYANAMHALYAQDTYSSHRINTDSHSARFFEKAKESHEEKIWEGVRNPGSGTVK